MHILYICIEDLKFLINDLQSRNIAISRVNIIAGVGLVNRIECSVTSYLFGLLTG